MNNLFKTIGFAIICLILPASALKAQQKTLRQQIQQVAATIDGKVGVAIINLKTNDTLTLNGYNAMVMHSVMKLPIAMAVLHEIDKGKLQLNQQLYIAKAELLKDTWSPLRDKYPNGNVKVPLSTLLSYMVSQSDNNACDILLARIGGPAVVERYIHSLGIKNIAIKTSEAQMATAWNVQYSNWCYATAITGLLKLIDKGSVLSKPSNAFLYKILRETTTGPKRLRGLLPADAIVAHKTGSSGTNDKGLSPATNDAGIITLPNGQQIAIAVLITDTYADEAKREGVIAKISRLVWDNYNK
ncbi:CepA family extended-spectrum class A beta-lactamase [Mucilaginibacter gynuensis]|uniref:beta-lactamase n=1 Tax=Mucilaginibacter gynuensis TaxID=1302236 RepID=A0ABP8HKF3_9SPHI